MSKARKAQFKILSFSTTMRNPLRIASFLRILASYENKILKREIIMQIISDLIANKLYIPIYASRNFKEIIESSKAFSKKQIAEIIINSPQNHKEAGFARGWESRFDTFYKLPMEFGFCFYEMQKEIRISHTGHLLIDSINENNDANIANIFLNCLMKYQSNNPFRKTLNANKPLILLLNVMQNLKNITGHSKVHKSEIAFFLCALDSNATNLTQKIIDFRAKFPHFAYTNEIIYAECLKILDSTNTIRFKISQICGEGIDEYIRKMRITGIITLVGGGFFIDFNSFESPKIEYILKHYSTPLKAFDSKDSYFKYMGEIDSNILNLKEKINNINLKDLKIKTLEAFAKNYTKDSIQKELAILASKKMQSKDNIFKFIPEAVRFEFLSAIILKQYFGDMEVLPNYSIDDTGVPKCHASGNMPDIICITKDSKSLVEVSLLCTKAQVHNELITIARHLQDSIKHSNKTYNFAIFIAPKIHQDSIRYVKFIKHDENLDIRNMQILEFIDKIKTCKSIKEL